MAGAAVSLRDVHKRYGDVHVVRGVSLDIEPGEFLVLVGPSGCGKSTLLRMIAGLEAITAGTVSIGGRVVNEVPPKDRDIGMVFQSYALYPHMRVRENLAFGLTLRKTPAAEVTARVDAAARMLGLEPLLDRYPKALSGGQRQRVAIGRAIVREPKVFLFDEPLSNLDAALRVQTRGELAGLHRRLGATMVYVTHDQVEAMTLATRIAVLHEGVLQQVGPPLELYERPANRFVASFIGSPAMTFLPGRATVERGRLLFRPEQSGHAGGEGSAFELGSVEGDEATFAGRAVLGLRPQALSLQEGPVGIPASVTVVEPMGAETFIHAFFPAIPSEGGVIHVGVDARRAHLFAEDGRALRHGVPA